jgi:hypothetical protein
LEEGAGGGREEEAEDAEEVEDEEERRRFLSSAVSFTNLARSEMGFAGDGGARRGRERAVPTDFLRASGAAAGEEEEGEPKRKEEGFGPPGATVWRRLFARFLCGVRCDGSASCGSKRVPPLGGGGGGVSASAT